MPGPGLPESGRLATGRGCTKRRALLSASFAGAFAALVLWSNPAAAQANGVFLTEYVEGSSNNKALEITNGTANTIDLGASSYDIRIFLNGSSTATSTIALGGTVPAGDDFVLVNSSSTGDLLARADQSSSSLDFNGDDAVELRAAGSTLDVIGQIGLDPGAEWGTGLQSTADNTLRRKLTVTAGDTNGTDVFVPATEWDGFVVDTFSGVGDRGTGDQPPTAMDDLATVLEDSGANALFVLDNDPDADGGPKLIISTSTPVHGAVVITGAGSGLTYQPAANYCGPDAFTYTLNPGASVATVSIAVTCVDDMLPPTTNPLPVATGRRGAALKKCKKKHGRARAKCRKKAMKLPV